MEPFRTHKGTAAVLMNDNIDTDQIIPKQYLKRIERTGFGKFLFDEWRYDNDRHENPNFPLNAQERKGASILITGDNFGCGSSREHARGHLMIMVFVLLLQVALQIFLYELYEEWYVTDCDG